MRRIALAAVALVACYPNTFAGKVADVRFVEGPDGTSTIVKMDDGRVRMFRGIPKDPIQIGGIYRFHYDGQPPRLVEIERLH